jgi:hypothetical protein
LIGDKVVGLGGVYFQDNRAVVFSEFTPGLSRRHRAEAFRFLESEFRKWPGRLFAVCDDRFISAPGLLRRLGFSPGVAPSWWVREVSHA